MMRGKESKQLQIEERREEGRGVDKEEEDYYHAVLDVQLAAAARQDIHKVSSKAQRASIVDCGEMTMRMTMTMRMGMRMRMSRNGVWVFILERRE